ncbi:hypothetical protein PV646_06640 [Streptomyces sp. ID05-26A]|nr:hypothetical protein [Streptomyces sp. ID05-26A]
MIRSSGGGSAQGAVIVRNNRPGLYCFRWAGSKYLGVTGLA